MQKINNSIQIREMSGVSNRSVKRVWKSDYNFSKITETACLPVSEFNTGVTITRRWNWMNTVHVAIGLDVLNRRPSVELLSEQFLWFFKNDLLQFHRIFLLFDGSSLFIFQMCFMRRTIKFDVVDFSQRRRSEELL